mmetsp:Transcript_59087/g.183443  ORF Transcript_59087/g.183443 Transcript_59087/m.183443 type:complete len:232 (+) Transcript_59087:145-840(+)
MDACEVKLARCVAQRRGIAERNCGGGPCDIVFVGDSLLETLLGRGCFTGGRLFADSAQAYRELVVSRHPKSMVLAGSGDETQQTLHLLDTALPVLKAPKLFVVMIGTNNVPKGGAAGALRGIRAVVGRLHKEHPTTPVLLHTLLPRADDGERRFFQAHIDEVNAELPALVGVARAAGAPVELVDCSGALHRDLPQLTEHYYDGVHLRAVGYRAWLSCLVPKLDRAVAAAER